ncbi:MAG: hypothetical protein NWR72_03750 [Bacteroidia bacterium]|nr:hypothetical protein [Bacteroidia bacterium]
MAYLLLHFIKKSWVIILAFLPQVVVSQPPNTREVPQGATYRVSVFEQQQTELEQTLRLRLESYSSLPSQAKAQGKIEIESLLYALFDLNMSQLEAQSRSLRAQLEKMQEDPGYDRQSAEILRLQQSLKQVDDTLKYRRQYRTAIVEQRVKDLING